MAFTFKMREKGLADTDTYEFYNANPDSRQTGDCSTRALAKALGVSYDAALDLQCEEAKRSHFGLTSDETIDAILVAHGFRLFKQGSVKKGQKRKTVGDVAATTKGAIAVIRSAHHLSAVVDGVIYDTWNPSKKTAYSWLVKEVV